MWNIYLWHCHPSACRVVRIPYGLSPLSQKSESDCLTKVRLSHKSETVAQKWDSLTFLRQCGQAIRRITHLTLLFNLDLVLNICRRKSSKPDLAWFLWACSKNDHYIVLVSVFVHWLTDWLIGWLIDWWRTGNHFQFHQKWHCLQWHLWAAFYN